MMTSRRVCLWICCGVALTLSGAAFAIIASRSSNVSDTSSSKTSSSAKRPLVLQPRSPFDTSGFGTVIPTVTAWDANAMSPEPQELGDRLGYRMIERLDNKLEFVIDPQEHISRLMIKAACFMYERDPGRAYDCLRQARTKAESSSTLARPSLASIIYFQGVSALRRGENENCLMCRGESSCILPIRAAAVHQNPEGSRLAVKHFTEYLDYLPEELDARWLLNVAYMTLGEHPHKVPPMYLISLDQFQKSEVDIGKFRDIGHAVGVDRLNEAGGVVMDDFDNDGLLDLLVTSFDSVKSVSLYRNNGHGTFEVRPLAIGGTEPFGGFTCVQTDYNNDGLLDVYISRGAWLPVPLRPTLLRNDGKCSFTDVTEAAGLHEPVNSNAALWADYDNDGWLDLFVCCERQPHRLYRNLRDGTFENVTEMAGLISDGQRFGKGCTWIDYDNDDFPDLFINYYFGSGQLYHNDRDGRFTNVTSSLGIDGPISGFSCWSWDYDNDGWLDIFASCYDRTLKDVVKGLIGEPHGRKSNKLYRNLGGQGFQDVTREAGLDMVFATMGSNYGDFDNDGFLDMYLGTGEPDLGMLVPNRMFKNLAGKRFAEITGTAGVGHLQKGHGIACGDWDRDGNIDIFIQMGGVVPGDRYHNILFQNPGHDHHWLTVKLVGKKSNAPALGARIKVVTAGDPPLTVYRHVSPGGSFGSSPLEQTIGLALAERIALLEIHWPTSGTTQEFRDLDVNQALEVTEFAHEFRVLDRRAVKRSPETSP